MVKKKLFAFGLIVLASVGCMGRGLEIRDARVGNLSKVSGQKIDKVYFKSFDVTTAQLKGDHGAGSVLESNKAHWFTHVMIGVQNELDETKSATKAFFVKKGRDEYDKMVEGKKKTQLNYSPTVPSAAIVVTGKYLFSENISGTSRAFLGSMSGKSWTRAEVTISQGKEPLYTAVIDGKYLGGGFSWGYETLGANEGLGKAIAQVIQKIEKGELK